jgi:hypothetical protein
VLRCRIGAAVRVVGGLVGFEMCEGRIWSLPLEQGLDSDTDYGRLAITLECVVWKQTFPVSYA